MICEISGESEQTIRMMKNLYRKLFLANQYFTIGVRPFGQNTDYRIILSEKWNWIADPMIAEENGKAWLFYETVENGPGRIEVREIMPDCSFSEPVPVLIDDGHYSYPFVFQYDSCWYMIPETSSCSEVRLYEAKGFPNKWEIKHILLREQAVDTTVFEYNGHFFLLTFLINGKDETVRPKAYELDIKNGALIRELNWLNPNGLSARGAGPIFQKNGRRYRPAQINQEHSYGDGIVIYEIDRCDTVYAEHKVFELPPPQQKMKGKAVTGMHTYTVSKHYEAIDIRVSDIDLLKAPKRALKALRHLWGSTKP